MVNIKAKNMVLALPFEDKLDCCENLPNVDMYSNFIFEYMSTLGLRVGYINLVVCRKWEKFSFWVNYPFKVV